MESAYRQLKRALPRLSTPNCQAARHSPTGLTNRRAKRDEVLTLLADNPKGITARELQRAKHKDTVDEARALLAQMEADGELTGKDSKPETGGHVTRTFTNAQK